MVKGGIPYRDTVAAPGSELHKAITEGDLKRANAIYLATTARFVDLMKDTQKFDDVPF